MHRKRAQKQRVLAPLPRPARAQFRLILVDARAEIRASAADIHELPGHRIPRNPGGVKPQADVATRHLSDRYHRRLLTVDRPASQDALYLCPVQSRPLLRVTHQNTSPIRP